MRGLLGHTPREIVVNVCMIINICLLILDAIKNKGIKINSPKEGIWIAGVWLLSISVPPFITALLLFGLYEKLIEKKKTVED